MGKFHFKAVIFRMNATNPLEPFFQDTVFCLDGSRPPKLMPEPDELRLMLAKLGSRCEDLEGSLREESHAAYIESTRAKSAEDRFQKLLGWARKEEERRRRAEEGLVRASEEGRALEARVTVADQEVRPLASFVYVQS